MARISYPEEIQSFFNEIIEEIKDKLDPECILIAGSFGKGSWLYAGEKLLSDFEFVFVCKKRWSLKRKKKLLNDLNDKYFHEISLKGYLLKKVQRKIISNYSFKNLGYIDLTFYDTFSDPQILYSKSEIDFPKLDINEIPVWEAWRLFVNRLGDILYMLVNKDRLNDNEIKYYWLKCFETIADTYLIVNHFYEKSILKRFENFSQSLLNKDPDINTECANSFDMLKLALLSRASHDINDFNIYNNYNENDLLEIISLWSEYIERKMYEAENMPLEYNNRYDKYLSNKKLNNKYLGLNFNNKNLIVSNLLKLTQNRLIFNNSIKKLSSLHHSWRHLILLVVFSTFREYAIRNGFSQSKVLLSYIVKEESIPNDNKEQFIKLVLKYWKRMR